MVIWFIGGKRQIRISLICTLDNNEFGVSRMLYPLIRDGQTLLISNYTYFFLDKSRVFTLKIRNSPISKFELCSVEWKIFMTLLSRKIKILG